MEQRLTAGATAHAHPSPHTAHAAASLTPHPELACAPQIRGLAVDATCLAAVDGGALRLQLIQPSLTSRPKVRRAPPSVDSWWPHTRTDPRHRQPHSLHPARTLGTTGGDHGE